MRILVLSIFLLLISIFSVNANTHEEKKICNVLRPFLRDNNCVLILLKSADIPGLSLSLSLNKQL